MRVHAPEVIQDHNVPKNGEHLVRLMEALPDGGTPSDVPEALRPKSGFANTYCRLWWNKPSTTITRNLSCVSSSRCIHPLQPRPLSTREGARLQGFPDDYKFYGSRTERNLQIGNAVPVFLSAAIKDSVKAYLAENDEEKNIDAGNLPLVRYNPHVIFVEPKEKQRGIRYFQQLLSIPDEDIVVFGDGMNDRSMIEYAGVGVAMQNAEQPAEKRICARQIQQQRNRFPAAGKQRALRRIQPPGCRRINQPRKQHRAENPVHAITPSRL